nr:MAG TPA: protein of unknown function (DUF4462) [Caudoviricetes sp.]
MCIFYFSLFTFHSSLNWLPNAISLRQPFGCQSY